MTRDGHRAGDRLPTRDYWPTDGWRTAAPGALGMDVAGLEAAHTHLLAEYPTITSLLVVRGGSLVFEHYADPSGPDTLHNVKSVTKSVTSALIGIAIATGDLAGLDETLGYVFPEAFTAGSDPRKRDITVGDLLTMRSGLDWEEWRGTTLQMTASKNWVEFVLDRPVRQDPGTAFNYSTGDTQLLAAILQRVTGMPALAFADLYLFNPLGIERRTWPTDPQGIHVGGAELSLRARDMAKIGYLMLNRGHWDGDQLLPADWVQAATAPHTEAHADARGCPLEYGYLWWLRPQGPYESALAVGYGGQYIYVIPALDMVVVLTGDLRRVPPHFVDNRMLCQFNLVEDFIVPAVIDAPGR